MHWNKDITAPQGLYRVLLKRGEFVDAARDDRAVAFKMYYPADHDLASIPVILWSHGFGGNRDGAAFISRYLASYGYILVHITHLGTDSSLWEGKPGHPWDILRKADVPRSATMNRLYDVPFVLDCLPAWAADNADVGAYMDLTRLGMSGHSFGAMTTQVMAGQKFPNEDGRLVRLFEPRFRAGILYSPVPISHLVNDVQPDELYSAIEIPLLYMTGTEDASPLHKEIDYKHRLDVYEHSGRAAKYLQVLEGGDHMIYNGTRGKLAENDLRDEHEAQIKIAALAFWDAYLKDDAGAMAWLEGDLRGL